VYSGCLIRYARLGSQASLASLIPLLSSKAIAALISVVPSQKNRVLFSTFSYALTRSDPLTFDHPYINMIIKNLLSNEIKFYLCNQVKAIRESMLLLLGLLFFFVGVLLFNFTTTSYVTTTHLF